MKLPCTFTVLLCVVGLSSSTPPPKPMRSKGAAPEPAPASPSPPEPETPSSTYSGRKGEGNGGSPPSKPPGQGGRPGGLQESALASLVLGRRPCAELCAAGLGGTQCGRQCFIKLPAHLIKLFQTIPDRHLKPNATNYGRPRFEVCNVLCDNNLGDPICACPVNSPKTTKWLDVCQAFCKHGSYRLDGCPKCKIELESNDAQLVDQYLFNQDFWMEWCQYQCSNGDGGAACNCDLPPLMMNID